jgi:transcriptional regulator GlxA family with amidase domain
LLGDEAAAERPGRDLVMQRLLELMLLEAIRTQFSTSGRPDRGLKASLGDAKIAKALRAMHLDVRKRWTVGQLADVAGMSRSMFAQRFGGIVGLTPIDYLLRWRMALAKDALQSGKTGLSKIAHSALPSPERWAVRHRCLCTARMALTRGDGSGAQAQRPSD